MEIVDSHLHFDIINDAAIFDYMRQNLRAIIIWSYCEPRPQTFADLYTYFTRQAAFAADCSAQGLPCYRLAGIHPRNIPSNETVTRAKVDKLLQSQLGQVRGIGEIGLEKGTDAEKEILAMQVDFAKRHGLKACVHTPRQNKVVMAARALEIIEHSGIANEDVIFDHLDSGALVWACINSGYYAGITISPVKSKFDDALAILRENADKSSRIMLNSDLATSRLEDYRLYVDSVKALPPEFETTAGQTALNFFGI